MATKFSDIYSLFLNTIDDYSLADLEDDELMEVMEAHLMNGLIHLTESVSDIEDYDLDEKVFHADLYHAEKIALAKAMKLEWLNEKIYSEDLMRRAIGDRDYKAVQGTDYVRRLGEQAQKLKNEIEQDLINYSYRRSDFVGGLWD